jgi:ribosome-associated toxin RatA of RatAB toxin-antitoxin module
MPIVETSVWIDASLERVLSVAQDNESFPSYMGDVLSLRVTEREGGRVVSEWVGLVSAFGLKVRWTQEDVWDLDAGECRFRQIKGDYDRLEGVWRFSPDDGGVRFESVVDYDFAVPGLGAVVKGIVHGLVVKNLESTLQAIKERAENRATV